MSDPEIEPSRASSEDAEQPATNEVRFPPPPQGVPTGMVSAPLGIPTAQTLTPGLVLPGQVAAAVQVQVWQGQFPPPEAIEVYERIMPGAFNRIVSMAERQMEAQISLASNAQQAARDDTRRSHYLGGAVALAAMVGAFGCAMIGQPWVAGVLCGVPVLAVASAFVNNARGAIAVKVPAAPPAPQGTPASATKPQA